MRTLARYSQISNRKKDTQRENSSERRGRSRVFGHAFAEFSVAIVLLGGFVIALSALALVPIRFLIANGVFTNAVQSAALSETRSSASSLIDDAPLLGLAQSCGIDFGDATISIVCVNQSGGSLTVSGQSPVPAQWLPGGSNTPCTYSLHVDQKVTIEPLLHGMTSTFATTLHGDSCWENLGCDPTTKGFYINE